MWMKSLITRLKPAHLKMGQSRELLPPECGKQGGVPASGLAKLLCTVRKTALVALWAARLREPAQPRLPAVNLLRAVRKGAVGAAWADASVREERAEPRLVRALAAAFVAHAAVAQGWHRRLRGRKLGASAHGGSRLAQCRQGVDVDAQGRQGAEVGRAECAPDAREGRSHVRRRSHGRLRATRRGGCGGVGQAAPQLVRPVREAALVASRAATQLELAQPRLEALDLIPAVSEAAPVTLWASASLKLAHPGPEALDLSSAVRKIAVVATGAVALLCEVRAEPRLEALAGQVWAAFTWPGPVLAALALDYDRLPAGEHYGAAGAAALAGALPAVGRVAAGRALAAWPLRL
mmetsp:Transcript_119583/g.363852  ORF Transcript_119583/g.363852 Transcript_119583/m.363852 type:complete len:350 (+) Transcript_119583:93-1142(+)